MEIALLSSNSVKIRGKHASLVVDPQVKTSGDAVLLLSENSGLTPAKVEKHRLVIEGPGEYEIGGIKISSFGFGKDVAYHIRIDGLEVFVSYIGFLQRQDVVQKWQDKIKEYDVVVLNADSPINESLITTLSPKIAAFYGEKAEEAKVISSDVQSSSKVQVSAGKLPEEMEVVLLI